MVEFHIDTARIYYVMCKDDTKCKGEIAILDTINKNIVPLVDMYTLEYIQHHKFS